MVGIGMTMIAVALIGLVLLIKQQLATARWFHALAIAMAPTGIIAVLLGWFVTEVGRQPYSVYKVLRTADSISPVVAESVALTLLVFIIIYTLLFGAGVYYITRLIKTGPSEIDSSVSYRKIRTTL
jgi:Cytochrome bd-type quinol oxidase, subunit 1